MENSTLYDFYNIYIRTNQVCQSNIGVKIEEIGVGLDSHGFDPGKSPNHNLNQVDMIHIRELMTHSSKMAPEFHDY
jgi:hypothetical protein